MKIIIQLYIVTTLYCSWIHGNRLTPEQECSLRKVMKSLMKCKDNVGASISLVRNGEIIFSEGFGFRDLYQNLPMENDTKVNIASITKSFTASLAAQAIGRGLADWDTPILDILGPGFALEGQFRTQQASLRDVLSHNLGLARYDGVLVSGLNISRQELCMRRLRHFPSSYDFRTRYNYFNFGYILGSYVTEVLTGKTWETDVEQLLIDLGMDNTIHAAEIKPADWGSDIAYSYLRKDGVILEMPEEDHLPWLIESSPAGGIFSTATDMGKWMLFLLSNGKNATGHHIVPEHALTELFRANTVTERTRLTKPTFPVDKTRFAYGMGFVKGNYRGYERVHHTGAYSSYRCRMTLIRAMSVGVWACVTSPYAHGETVNMINMYALDLLLDKTPWLNETTACTFPSPWKSPKTPSSNTKNTNPENNNQNENCTTARDLEDYTGEYGHLAFGLFKIYLDEESEQLRYKFGLLLEGELSRTENPMVMFMSVGYPLNYTIELTDGPIYFESTSQNGVIESVKVPYFESRLPPVFKRGVQPVKRANLCIP